MIERVCDVFRGLFWSSVLAALGLVVGVANAAVIAPGARTTTVPPSLYDPLSSLNAGLQPGQFLLPIEISGASGLQDWSFDLTFDDSVVAPADAGGLYFSVYQAEFNAGDPTLSDITSSGVFDPLKLPGVLVGIGGFSSGVSGNGLLAFVLFEFLPDQSDNDPNFGIANPDIHQAPEPGTMLLLTSALLTLGWMQRGRARRPRAAAR